LLAEGVNDDRLIPPSAEQLMNHLKRLDLRLNTVLPLNPNALNPDKQTLNVFLAQLIKQQYLEKTKVAAPSGGTAGNALGTGKGGSTQANGTQRARATQSTRGGADAAAAGGEDGIGAGGSADKEWRWGPRAFIEIGEVGILNFVKDFYATLTSDGEDVVQRGGGGANQRVASNAARGAKDPRVLEKEILKGTTGGKGKKLQDAREEGQEADDE
jgi:hypothetical protein